MSVFITGNDSYTAHFKHTQSNPQSAFHLSCISVLHQCRDRVTLSGLLKHYFSLFHSMF